MRHWIAAESASTRTLCENLFAHAPVTLKSLLFEAPDKSSAPVVVDAGG